jgi:predicted nucleotidyltransferase
VPDVRERIRDYFLDDPEVAAVYLYGSFAKEEERRDSDVDIGVLSTRRGKGDAVRDRRLRYVADLSGMIDRDIDLVMLEEAGELLSYQVLKYGECLIENDAAANRRFRADRILLYFDFEPYMRMAGKGMIRAMKEGDVRG